MRALLRKTTLGSGAVESPRDLVHSPFQRQGRGLQASDSTPPSVEAAVSSAVGWMALATIVLISEDQAFFDVVFQSVPLDGRFIRIDRELT
jgi:hypothetical protein